jgi:hypothetical protein
VTTVDTASIRASIDTIVTEFDRALTSIVLVMIVLVMIGFVTIGLTIRQQLKPIGTLYRILGTPLGYEL